MDTVKDVLHKRCASKTKKSPHHAKDMKPILSSNDLDFIAEHTSVKKEDVSAT